jgi:hypothetical protein
LSLYEQKIKQTKNKTETVLPYFCVDLIDSMNSVSSNIYKNTKNIDRLSTNNKKPLTDAEIQDLDRYKEKNDEANKLIKYRLNEFKTNCKEETYFKDTIVPFKVYDT